MGQYSVAVRNAKLDAFQSTVGSSAILKFYSGTIPASCSVAASGTVLATLNLPSSWMSAASNGTKAMSGTWEDSSCDATGTISYARIFDSTSTTCHWQGTVTITGGGGDLTVDNLSVNTGQDIVVNSFTVTAGNA